MEDTVGGRDGGLSVRREGVMRTVAVRAEMSSSAVTIVVVVRSEEVLALHLPFQTRDVAVAKVFAEFLHFVQLKQVNPQYLNIINTLLGNTVLQNFILLVRLIETTDKSHFPNLDRFHHLKT
jgi:hypothetical protein